MKAPLLMPGGMALAVVALTAVLSACSGPAGQGAAAATGSASPAAAAPTAAAPVAACEPQNLLIAMDPNSTRTAGGSVYLPIDFVNKSVPCSLSGYPQVFALTATGSLSFEAVQLPAFPASAPAATGPAPAGTGSAPAGTVPTAGSTPAPTASPPPAPGKTPAPTASAPAPGGGLVLRRHYAAHVWVLIANVTGPRPAHCKEYTTQGLRLYAPGATAKQRSYVVYPFTSCVRGKHPVLSVFPFQQGLANPAIFP